MNEYDETRNDETSLYDDLYATDVADPPAEPDESAAASWRHPVNIGHLVMGVAFAGMVIVWAIFAGGAIADDNIGWLMGDPLGPCRRRRSGRHGHLGATTQPARGVTRCLQ